VNMHSLAQRIAPAQKTSRHLILEQFLADGMRYMFGNPGTVEQGFLDALWEYPELKYILSLHESVAVMMADGYARCTHKPTLVQIHSTPGLGNAIGALYQAMRGHSPLVVIGGDAGVKYQAMDAQMAGDLVAMAKPVTKWSTMVMDSSSVLRVLRRAAKIAGTPPMGPVYVCLPMDILDEPGAEDVHATPLASTRVVPERDQIREAAKMLAGASHPMIFVGDGIAYSGAQEELARVAEMLGAEVWEADAGEVNMAYSHPLYQGMTGHMFGYSSLPTTRKGDVSLVCGTYMLPEVFPELGDIFAAGAKVIHIDLNVYEIGKNHHVDLGLLGDPKLSLSALAAELEMLQGPDSKRAATTRLEQLANQKKAKRDSEFERDKKERDAVPVHMARFMEDLAPQLPDDAIVFDEALTNSPPVARYFAPKKGGQYFLTRGGSLGVGIPGAMGAKLANPGKTVFGFTGDGGSMYTIQALWTAARHNIGAKFVVCNNHSYRLLQLNVAAYWKERGIAQHQFPLSFDLSKPELQFVGMAQAMGVPGMRVEKPEQIKPAIREALATEGPYLIELVLEGDVRPDLIGVRCGQ
jgi:thiamine pyrophosphate-dependent acetolactate synthase large subunit-like protein